jgi:hypothetical protein
MDWERFTVEIDGLFCILLFFFYGSILKLAGTSTKNMEHWVQNSGKHCFREYDYGSVKLNEEHYGSDQPPAYDLSGIKLPVSLFGGGMDTAASPDDVDVLRKWLEASGIDVFSHFEPDYEHMVRNMLTHTRTHASLILFL